MGSSPAPPDLEDTFFILHVLKKMCKKTRNAIFLNENFDKFPNSYPRSHKKLNQHFSKYGFDLKKYSYKLEKINRINNKSFEFEKLLLLFKSNAC